MTDQAIVFDTPDGIEYAQLASVKHALRLESVGIKMKRGKSVKGMWAPKFGLSNRCKHEDLIEKINLRLDFLLSAKKISVTAAQLEAMCRYAEKHGPEWKAKLLESWQNGGDHAPELQQIRNQKGPKWLAALELSFERG